MERRGAHTQRRWIQGRCPIVRIVGHMRSEHSPDLGKRASSAGRFPDPVICCVRRATWGMRRHRPVAPERKTRSQMRGTGVSRQLTSPHRVVESAMLGKRGVELCLGSADVGMVSRMRQGVI
jgi:hypothetical protein